MARIIPNNNTFIGFIPVTNFGSAIANYPTSWNSSLAQPNITTSELNTSYDITPFVISVTAQTTGNTVPTPTLDSLFEGNIAGTVNASLTMDLYRDDASYTDPNTSTSGVDFAWAKLPRGQKGYVVISRFGGTSSNQEPAAGETIEIWPVVVTARTAGAVTSNTVQTFTITAAVPFEPAEAASVTSTSATPSAPLNLVGAKLTNAVSTSAPSIGLDWDVPVYTGTLGNGTTESTTNATGTPYVIQVSTTANGTFTTITQLTATSINSSTGSVHTTASFQALNTAPTVPVTSAGIAYDINQGAAKTLFFRVAARNANGIGTYSNVVSVANVATNS